MRGRPGSPLNRKLVMAVLSVSAIASLAVSTSQILYTWNDRQHEVRAAIENRVTTTLKSIALSTWNLDQPQVVAELEAITGDTSIVRAEVVVSTKPGIYAISGGRTTHYDFDQVWPLKMERAEGVVESGTLRVYGTDDGIRASLIKQGFFIIWTNALKGFLISFVLLAIFDRLVSRHIRALLAHFYRFNIDELDPMPRRQVRVRDEIDYLIDAVNDIQNSVKTAREREQESMKERAEATANTLELSHKIAAAEVTTSVLHDINNILGTLTAISLRAKRDQKSVPAEEIIATVVEGMERTTKIISGIIHTQQQLAIGHDDQWDTVHIKQLIDDAMMIEAYSLEKNRVRCHAMGDLDRVVVTKRHLMVTVLVNLIKNARESIQSANSEERTISISVVTHGSDFILAVKDTGFGATPASLAKIFERGFTTKATGHGFGLVGCRYNLKKLGGDIAITSDGPGSGATVTITHPIDAQSAQLQRVTKLEIPLERKIKA